MILMAPCALAIGQRLFCALAAMKAREPHSLHIAFTVWPMDTNDVDHIVRGQKKAVHGLTQASAQKSVYHELEAMYNVHTKESILH